MKWRNHAALLEIGASPREVDATPSYSLFVSSCFPLLINKRIFFHLSTTLYPTDRLTSSASSASSRFLSHARVGLYFEVSTLIRAHSSSRWFLFWKLKTIRIGTTIDREK